MLNDFQAVLAADKSLSQKHVPHYIRWVRDCYNYLRLPLTERLAQEQSSVFLKHLEASREGFASKTPLGVRSPLDRQ